MLLRTLTVGRRSAIAFSIIVAIVIALGSIALTQMRLLRQSEIEVETDWMPSVRQAGHMTSALLKIRLESVRGLVTSDPALHPATDQALDDARRLFASLVTDYAPLVSSDEELRLYQAVQAGSSRYLAVLDNFEDLHRRGDLQGAAAVANGAMREAAERLQDQIESLAALNDRGATASGIEASRIYDHGLAWTGGLILSALVVTTLLAVLLTRSITLPIGDALRIAQRIASKDLSKDIQVEGRDEAAGLLTALASMQENLRGTVAHLADSSSQLAAAAEEMNVVIEDGNRGLLRQNDEINQVATAVTEMSAAVDEVARNAEETAGASQHSSALTQAGLQHVGSTLAAIEQLALQVGRSSGQIQTLSGRAQDISNIVDVIRAIAEQTNLLALNAAIEAARAGDQGRGFAVVADEVRALAHRTQQSTREIETMINTIQHDSSDAVTSMQQSSQTATASLAVAREANGALLAIASAMGGINERNALIATAAEEQAVVAKEIDRGLVSIKDLSDQSAAGASQTSGASGEVSRLAAGLREVVAEFVI